MKSSINKKIIRIEKAVRYLTDIPELTPIPRNIILSKTLPGIGATHSEIISQRHSIIIVPNRATIENKHKSNAGTFAVYEGVTKAMLAGYLKSGELFKKIITTPEGFINKVKPLIGDAMYKDYFLLMDECHKAIVDAGYRPNIVLPMDDFFMFSNKAMVSATPLIPTDKRFISNAFTMVTLKPTWQYKRTITLIKTDRVIDALKLFIDRTPHTNYCIFFNSIQGIKSILDELQITKDYKVHCSKESVKIYKSEALTELYSTFEGCAKYNFFTSSFYNGLDMFTNEANKPHVIMLTDIKFADYTGIDPSTDAIQIAGRFRNPLPEDKSYDPLKSFTHIVKTSARLHYLTEEEVKQRIRDSKDLYEYLRAFKLSASDGYIQEVVADQLTRVVPYSNLLNDDKSFNSYKSDNLFYEESVKSHYKSIDDLLTAYQEGGRFNIISDEMIFWDRGTDTLKHQGGKYTPEIYREVADHLWELEEWIGTTFYEIRIKQLTQQFPLIVKAYYTLGVEWLVEYQYIHQFIMEAIALVDGFELKNKFPVIDAIHLTFKTDRSYTLADIKVKIQDIYDRHGIKAKVKTEDIGLYFEYRKGKKGKDRAYHLLRSIHNSAYVRI